MLVLARSAVLYRTRITNSIALLFAGAGFATLYHYTGLMVVGQLVPMLSFIILLICLFAGVHLTADSISREKRDGTLGLLFLTNLSPFQIVMGKLIAHGLLGFYAVLIAFPLLSLIMIVGGTRLLEVATIGLSALNILFFSCAVGLWASARHTDRKKAAASGTWMVLFFWWGIPLLVQGLLYIQAPLWLADTISAFAVNNMFNSAFAGPRMRLSTTPWFNLACTHLLAWFFVGFAVYYLRRRWQDAPAREHFSFREWWKRKSLGPAQIRQALRKQLLDRNPFFWLASRDRWRGAGVWITTVGVLIFMGFQVWLAGGDFGPVPFFTVLLSFIHKVTCAGVAAHQLSTEQEQGTLEMILSTPLKTDSILKGQILASIRQFRGPALTCVLLHVFCIFMFLYIQPIGRGAALVVAGIVLHALLYLLDLYIMIWGGMFGAVTVKEAKNAAGAAMFRIIFMPLLIFGLIVSSVSTANWYFRLGLDVHPALIVLLYLLIWIINSISWLIYFRRRLPVLLRGFALKRYTPDQKKGFWAHLGARAGKAWRVRTVRALN